MRTPLRISNERACLTKRHEPEANFAAIETVREWLDCVER
jgi:hypothetical protein